MEVGNHISENLSATRPPDNTDMNLGVERDYGTNATTSVTTVKIVETAASSKNLSSEGNHETKLADHDFTFSVITKNLNMHASELQQETAATPVFQLATPVLQSPEASEDLVHEMACNPLVESAGTSVFKEAISSLDVLDETAPSAVAKHAFTMIEEPVLSPLQVPQEQSSFEAVVKEPAEELVSNLYEKPLHELFSIPVTEVPVDEEEFNTTPKQEAPLRPFIHHHAFSPVENPVEEGISNSLTEMPIQASKDITEENTASELFNDPVMEEPLEEPSDSHGTNERVASAMFFNSAMEELAQEEPYENHVSEEQANSKTSIAHEIGAVESQLENPQAPQTEEPFDDMIVLEDGMVVTAPLIADTSPVIEGVKEEAASSKLIDSATPLEECKGTLEAKGMASEPIHEVQGNEFDVPVLHQGASDVDIHSNGAEQLDMPPVEDIPSDCVPDLQQEEGPVDYSTRNEHKESKEENEPLVDEHLGKASSDVETPINAQLASKNGEESSMKVDGKNLDQDAEALVSRKVLKRFGKKDYEGDIVSYDPKTKWFKVVYEDGDEEDLEKVDVEPILLVPGTAVEPAHKKRARSSDGDGKEANRAAKRQKKSTGKTPQKTPVFKNQKPATGSKRKRFGIKGSKSPGKTDSSSGSKDKGLHIKKHVRKGKKSKKQPTSSAKSSPGKKAKQMSKAAEGNDSQVSARKSPGKKLNQKAILRGSDNTLYKKVSGKQNQGQQEGKKQGAATSKNGPKGKKSYRTQKSSQKPRTPKAQKVEVEELKEQEKPTRGKKLPKHEESQVEDGLKNQIARAKRKAEIEKKVVPKSKRLKTEAGNADSNGSGHTLQSIKGTTKVKMTENNPQFDQDDNGAGSLLIGRRIKKKFGGAFYNGEVLSFDKKRIYYKVRYEDGDSEDLEWGELEPLLMSETKVTKKTVSKKNTKPSKSVHKRDAGTSREKEKQHTSGVTTRSRMASN